MGGCGSIVLKTLFANTFQCLCDIFVHSKAYMLFIFSYSENHDFRKNGKVCVLWVVVVLKDKLLLC